MIIALRGSNPPGAFEVILKYVPACMRYTLFAILSLVLSAQSTLAQRPLPLTVTDSSDGPLYSIAVWQNKIFVGGRFEHIDSLAAKCIAVKDSGNWRPLGSGVHGTVLTMCVDSNGGIYVGGKFDSAGGIAANNVAHWDGSQWHALGGGVNDTVYALMMDSDTLYCGGAFDSIENLRHAALGKWTSTGWSTTPLPIESGRIRGLARSGSAVAAVGWVKFYSDSVRVGLMRGSLPLVGFPELYHTAELAAVVFHRYGVITSGPPERSHLPGRRFSDYYYSFLNSISVAGEASKLVRIDSKRFIACGSFDSIGETRDTFVSFYDGASWRAFTPVPPAPAWDALYSDTNIIVVGGAQTFGYIAASHFNQHIQMTIRVPGSIQYGDSPLAVRIFCSPLSTDSLSITLAQGHQGAPDLSPFALWKTIAPGDSATLRFAVNYHPYTSSGIVLLCYTNTSEFDPVLNVSIGSANVDDYEHSVYSAARDFASSSKLDVGIANSTLKLVAIDGSISKPLAIEPLGSVYDLTTFPRGLYLYRLQTDEGLKTGKLLLH